MPAIRKLRLYLVFIIPILILCILMAIGFWYVESERKIATTMWKVISINSTSDDISKDFDTKSFVLRKDGSIMLPWHKNTSASGFPIKYATYKYRRRCLTDGVIEINDNIQNIFTGIYEIDILEHQRPQLVRIYSDRIEFLLREQYFSLEKPYIEMEWNIPENSIE